MSRLNTIRLLLAVLILAVFGRIATHDFVDWDDGPLIYTNTNLTTHSLSGLMEHWNPFNAHNTNMYNPLVFTLWWGLAWFSELQSPDLMGATLNPYSFHIASLVVHWLCACAVLEILRRLKIREWRGDQFVNSQRNPLPNPPPDYRGRGKEERYAKNDGRALGDWAAAAGAAIFAVHPLQTESVAWASAMKDLLSTLFALLTILQYLIAVESVGPARTRRYWLMTAFFAAALLSKPSTVVLPMVIAAIGRVIYRRPWGELARWTGWWYALALGFVLVASRVQTIPEPVGGPLWERPLVAMDAVAFYLWKLVWPVNLTFDYERNPTALLTDAGLHHALYWTWVFPVGLAIIIWRSRQKMLVVAGLIFVLGLLPVLGIFEFAFQYFTTVADRYVYFPMLGVAVAVAWLVDRRGGKMMAVVVAVVVVVLGSLSFVQAERWTDTQTLFEGGPIPRNSLHYMAIGEYHDRMAVPYIRVAEKAAQLGDAAEAKAFQGDAVAEYERAMGYYRTAIQLEPTNTHGYDHLAKDLVIVNRIPDAIEVVKEWLAVEPNKYIVGEQKAGTLQAMLGTLYLKNHQYREAVEMLRESLELRDDPDVRRTLDLAEKLLEQTSTRP